MRSSMFVIIDIYMSMFVISIFLSFFVDFKHGGIVIYREWNRKREVQKCEIPEMMSFGNYVVADQSRPRGIRRCTARHDGPTGISTVHGRALRGPRRRRRGRSRAFHLCVGPSHVSEIVKYGVPYNGPNGPLHVWCRHARQCINSTIYNDTTKYTYGLYNTKRTLTRLF